MICHETRSLTINRRLWVRRKEGESHYLIDLKLTGTVGVYFSCKVSEGTSIYSGRLVQDGLSYSRLHYGR